MEHEGASYYREFLIMLAAAGIVVPLFVRIGVSAILGFLIVGIILGPGVLGYLSGYYPPLQHLALADDEALEALGELGVVFLLFLIGLELSFERLRTMRRIVFGLGGLQVILGIAVIGLGASLLGFGAEESIVLGMALALSSTAIVVELLSSEKRLGSQTGRLSFAILLFQDIAVVPILLLVSIMGRENQGSILWDIATALAHAGLAIGVIVVGGRYILRPLLRSVAHVDSSDLFMAMTLLIAVGTGFLATMAGLSMALGAFIAGLMLAETEYRRAIEAIIEPFKGLLLGAFFLLVGLRLDLAGLLQEPLIVVGITLVLIAVKAAVIYGLAMAFRLGRTAALESALLLGPCGEFGLVVTGAAVAAGVLQPATSSHALLIISISMILIPAMARIGRTLRIRLAPPKAAVTEAEIAPPADAEPRVIIAGYGRVGHLIGSMLAEHKIPFIAVDHDADLVARERRAGHPVYFGDATNPQFLRRCGIATARAIAVSMDSPARVDDVTRTARAERADLKIIARARDERHAIALYGIGATEAVPETIEASLQLCEAILVETGVPMGLAIAAVHERRDQYRKLLDRPNRREIVKQLRDRRRKVIETS